MRLTRSVAAGAAALVSLGTLTACGSGGDAAEGGEGGGDVDLKLWHLTQEGAQGDALDAIIADFEEANPGITVTLEQRATDPHKDALRQVAGTDAGPDIYFYWAGPGLGGELVDAGVSLDLAEYYEQYGWEDQISDAAMASITQYGGYHGVPWTQQAEALYYNKELFEQAGITSPPETYEELVDAADKLVAEGITPITFGGTVNWHVMRLLDSLIETFCGAETADQLNVERTGWDSEECVTEAFTELKTWGDEYLNEGFLGVSDADAQQLFFTGSAAMALEGSWFNGQLIDNGMDPANIGIVPFPTGTGRIYGFSEALYISTASEHPDEAAMFLDHLISTEAQQKASGTFSAIAFNTEVEPSSDNPLHELWVPIMENATGLYINNDQNLSLEQTTEYWRIQNSVLTGDIAPQDAGAEFQKFLDAS